MKVAIVSATPTFPTNAGNRSRVLNLARAIRALGHELHFIYLDTSQQGGVDLDAHVEEFGSAQFSIIRRLGIAKWTYRAKRTMWLLRRFVARKVGSAHGYYNGIDELYSRHYSLRLHVLQQKHAFDAVFAEYVFYSRALDVFPESSIKVIDLHDIFADRHVPFVNGASVQPYMFSISAERECAALRRAHVVLAIQSEEARALSEQMDKNNDMALGKREPRILSLSHFLDFSSTIDCAMSSHASFVGSNSQPNRDAMEWVVKRVMPLIVSRLPDFRLYVAGSIAQAIPDHSHIVKLGQVARVSDAFEQAPISINPMGIGTGINIKLLESMAAGIPVVTTRLGARGVDSHHAEGLSIIEDNDEQAFADAIVQLAQNAALRVAHGLANLAAAHRWQDTQMATLRATLDRSNVRAAALGPAIHVTAV